jgi:hypothetical protein
MYKQLLPEGSSGLAAHYDWKQDRRLLFGIVGAALLLVGAIGTGLPIGFFTFERWYVCLVAAVIAYFEEKRRRALGALVAVVAAILFNPLITIHLNRATWFPIDLATAVWLAWIALEGFASNKTRWILRLCPGLVIVGAGLFSQLDYRRFGRALENMKLAISAAPASDTSNDTVTLVAVEGDPFANLVPADPAKGAEGRTMAARSESGSEGSRPTRTTSGMIASTGK